MIRLKSINYVEFEGEPQEWRLEKFSLGSSNLIVGKNASGKTRTLNLIGSLALNLAGIVPPGLSSTYDAEYLENEHKLNYHVKYDEQRVVEERFLVDDIIRLDRGNKGEGEIFASAINNGVMIRFQTPTSELAAVARRDTIQHGFLESLHVWASSVRYYSFGTALGKDNLALLSETTGIEANDRNPNTVIGLFMQAKEDFGEKFIQPLINDMRQLNYDIHSIGTMPPISIRFPPGARPIVGLYVQENDLEGKTDQTSMSQGMFRALSILILVNYSQITGKSSCILIDDIGEGLDFDRSCRLVNLLRDKANTSNVQLIMSTNDRFIMNQVPIEEWAVIQRKGSHVRVLNYENSKDLFEEFKFTGLSNFSFLEMDFANSHLDLETA